MKIQPQLLKYTDIDTTVMSQNSKGAWVPARPMPYLYRSSIFTSPDYCEVQAAFRKWDEESHPMLQRTVLTAFEAGVDYALRIS